MLNDEELKNMFTTYKNSLYSFIYSKVNNKHDAEDIFSKSFIKFFNYAKNNPVNLETVKSFLFTITSNTMKDFFRRAKIIKFVSLDKKYREEENKLDYYEFFEDKKATLEFQKIDDKNLIHKINLIASELPEKQKEAFYLRFIEGFSFADIAKIQSTSVNTVLSRVRYAVLKIKESCEGDKGVPE